MSLPNRRTTDNDAGKAGIRPRPIQTRAPAILPTEVVLLHFSCPACLRMVSCGLEVPTATCGNCGVIVVPPKVYGA